MTNVDCEVGVVSHRFASIHSLLTTQTDSFTNKNLRKNHLRDKKEDLRKTLLNYWYSIQNRSKQNRITKSQQTFFDFFLKTGVTFPFFSSLIYETRLVAVAERHTRSDCGHYLLDTIYIYVSNLSGHPSWCPSLRFYHPIYPFPFDFWIKNLQVKKVNPYAAISFLECDGWYMDESQQEYGVVRIRVRRRGSGV